MIEQDHLQRLRNYLKEGLPFALNQDDFNGHLKAHLALALARVGEPSDMDDVHRLIRAEIDRRRRGREALLRGEQGPLTNGAHTSWANWYVRAVCWLDPERADETLLDLLYEPEYEQEAATALIQLATIQSPEKPLGLNRPDYRLVREARLGRRATRFDEKRRIRYATAIKKRLSSLMADRSESDDSDWFNRRLKQLAQRLAVIDGSDSDEFVMEIMMLPCQWDQWTRADAIEALLFGGARMKAERVLDVLNPTIDYTLSHLHYDQQAQYLLQRCLCLLSFLEPPATGIIRIKEVVAATPFLHYELREIVTALGHNRSKDALEFLLELARTSRDRFTAIAAEWIEAIAALDIPESKQVLLSFIDPDIQQLGVEQYFDHYNRERLTSHIADIVRADSALRERLYLLCNRELSQSMRLLLAEVVTALRTADAVIAGLNLIHDDATPPIPFSLTPFQEDAFFEHRPYGTGGSYTRVPRNAAEIRKRLFTMVLNDDTRRRSAWKFLGQIESWRLEYGRPSSEPRHPSIDSEEPWPPLALAAQLNESP